MTTDDAFRYKRLTDEALRMLMMFAKDDCSPDDVKDDLWRLIGRIEEARRT
jgi:hypothetical protein